MKKITYMGLTLLLAIFVQIQTTQAGWVTAPINKLLFYEGGNLIYIFPKGGTGALGNIACHGSNGDYISYKMSRPMAKEYVSALMMAFAANRSVTFRYLDDCVDQSVSITLSYFTVNQ